MHNNVLIFDGVSTERYSTFITDAGIYESPEPQYEKIAIDGRNGDLLIEKDKYNNITVRYPAIVYEDFEANYERLRAMLLSKKGYKRIEDTFIPDRFRLGRFTSNLNPKYPYGRKIGSFDINFYCKPQWYLKSGETVINPNFKPDGTMQLARLYNPTDYTAYPLIRVFGYGAFWVNGARITIFRNETGLDHIDIDTEAKDSFYDTTSMNAYVQRDYKQWPVLQPGVNLIRLSSTITRFQITPRWYVL